MELTGWRSIPTRSWHRCRSASSSACGSLKRSQRAGRKGEPRGAAVGPGAAVEEAGSVQTGTEGVRIATSAELVPLRLLKANHPPPPRCVRFWYSSMTVQQYGFARARFSGD